MQTSCSICAFLGRIGLAGIFLLAGIGKFLGWEETAHLMASKVFNFIPFFLVSAAVVEIVGGLLLIIGYKARIAAAVLFLFLAPTTLIFHNFWDFAGAERSLQLIHFLKNIAILGGLLYVIGFGAGSLSVDRCCERKG
jgi:putative oxidoreductase